MDKVLIFLLCAALSPLAWAAAEVGEVSYSRGVLTGQVESEAPRLLGKGIALHEGETLNTGSSGFAVIKLEDGSRMTLRPNTTFKIEQVDTRPGNENAVLRLFRGGFRAVTGFISKRNPDAFKVNTSIATIGIRGTDFDARLCEQTECDEENRATGEQAQNESRVIGRIALLRGQATAVDASSQSRQLSTGAAVYEMDQIETGIKSFAVIAFNDKSRITMSAASAFRIDQHQYQPEAPEQNNAFLSFIRGGLRLVTGAIGKLNRDSYRVATPTATIGIRGTGFDLVCDGDCADTRAWLNPYRQSVIARLLSYFIKPVFAIEGNGMYARVWEGAIEFEFQGGNMLLENGKAAFLKNAFTPPVVIPDLPIHLRKMGGAPRPDKVEINQDLFGGIEQKDIKPGLYVNVRDGDVQVNGADGSATILGKGEASVSAFDGATARLNFVPPFQKFDKVPEPDKLTPRMQKMINLFGESARDKREFECRIQ